MKRSTEAALQILIGSFIFLSVTPARAQTGGSIAGTVRDSSGSVIPDIAIIARNTATGVRQNAVSNVEGFYAFTAVPVGHYDLETFRPGFKPYRRTDLIIDINTALQIDITLEVGEQSQQVTVSDTAIHVETASTQVGEVVTGTEIIAVALNGRSFTDLMSLQPGIVPMTTQQPDSIVMAGASVAIAPSGGLNPGNQSISGQREDANGFMVNGGDVKELMNGGTTIVPNLDSIAEFRILTDNFDAEYGNYSGGIVNVVTKSGSNQLHGSAFDFLRNTALDAKNYFSSERSKFDQNQFGGTVGGPIAKDKVFFFGDYQGTRTQQGIDTGLIPVPSSADRSGSFLDQASSLTGRVSGSNLAGLLSRELGYPVSANEPYFTPGCTSSTCVFPNAIIPQRAWSAPAKHLLQYIPVPNTGPSTFSTGAQSQLLRDDKGSLRIDGSIERWGELSAYYYFDDYNLNNPYPTGQGGASVPGFNALTLGRAQLLNLGDVKTFGSSTVNEFHVSFMRNSANVGKPQGGVGPSLASQGFATGVGTSGIVPLDPSIEGIENVRFNSFTFGVPITNLAQANNTFMVNDSISKVLGTHILKAGADVSFEQVNVHPDATFNGSFLFTGQETGSDFADFLIGVANNYNQADSESYYGRHKYVGAFVQDSWRIRPNLTLNYGLRWELMQYWSEKYNQIPTFILGEQSKVFTTAPTSLVYPGDAGVSGTLVPQRSRFSPRLGVAYSPGKSDGWLGKILGGPGKTSIRAGYGIFYSVIEGNTIAIDEPQPPYGLSYTSPESPLFATPFIGAPTGTVHVNPFPLTFPAYGFSPSHRNTSIDFSPFLPQAGMTAPPPSNTYPYSENYFLSIERQLTPNTVVNLSYIGSEAHHLLVVYSANPGNPALCLALSQPSEVAPGSPTCGPGGEDRTYVTAAGKMVNGTRGPLGPNFANDSYDASIGNSNYNALETSVRHTAKGLSFGVSYTYSKSIDQASSIADPVDPFNFNATRALSAWDLTNNLVVSYEYQLPLERLGKRAKFLTQGWALSGITRASSGFPLTISEDADRSLQGSIPNGVNNKSVDLPDLTPGNLNLNSTPQNGQPYFNTALFVPNALGTPGNSPRRFFYGPGAFNTDLALLRNFNLSEAKTLQFRLETFNVFNHTQFFGPASVAGDFSSTLFGQVVKAAPPRLVQLALKFTF
jgi:Carboxypeptidase regulatory-like domain